jgi:hypothetical protein
MEVAGTACREFLPHDATGVANPFPNLPKGCEAVAAPLVV